jgi:putative DNA methylase
MSYPKKLIEVALPLAEINDASAYDKMPGIGAHPKGIHHWWARLPLPAARAILFASVINDPSEDVEKLRNDTKALKDAEKEHGKRLKVWNAKKIEHDKAVAAGLALPDLDPEPTVDEILIERKRAELFAVISDLVQKKPHENPTAFQKARKLIAEACGDKIPEVLDPFTGGGSIPLEAQRLGFQAHGRDLNPVPALITKATIDFPARFYGKPALNPRDRNRQDWRGAQGLGADVQYYGDWILKKAKEKLEKYYPTAKISEELVQERSDLAPYKGKDLPVIAWIWARTIPSPNPILKGKEVPLVTTFWLSTKKGKEAYVEPIIKDGDYTFTIRTGRPANLDAVKNGTKTGRSSFTCLLSGVPIENSYVKSMGQAGKIGQRLMAVVCEGKRSRVYLPPDEQQEKAVQSISLDNEPSHKLNHDPRSIWCIDYGVTTYADLFSPRQRLALQEISSLIKDAHHQAFKDGLDKERAHAVATYLAFAVDRLADFNCSMSTWKASGEQQMHLFTRQSIPMAWDFAEANVLGDTAICWLNSIKYAIQGIETTPILPSLVGDVKQQDASTTSWNSHSLIISTDPPYYDNIPYADLSDFFYVWLRRALKDIYPDLFTTLLTPKAEELIASPYRHEGSKEAAKEHFESGFRKAFAGMREAIDPRFPLTVYYAMKQSEGEEGTNTGWETLLTGLIDSGFQITATWPVRAAQDWRMISMGTNALANYVVLACRERPVNAPLGTRREFVNILKKEMPHALHELQTSNIGAVDFFQAALGPGMAIFSRFSKIVEADGNAMTVGSALKCINQEVATYLSKQTGEMDSWTRFAAAWFAESAFASGDYGKAETLALSLNVSVDGVRDAGIIESGAGKVRLYRPSQLPADWDPMTDARLTIWEIVHHLIRLLNEVSETSAASVLSKVGALADDARSLCYRLYTICEQKKWADEARDYNALIAAWPELTRLAQEQARPAVETQADLGV